MGQYWNLVCWDNRQASGHMGKLGEFFDCRDSTLVPLLHKTQTPNHVAELFPKLLEGGYSRFSVFELLPRMLLVQICKELIELSLDDVYHLALASPAFFEPAWSTFVKEKTWAGKRIVCIGDYADGFPPGMLTKEEEVALNREKEEAPNDYKVLYHRAEYFESSSRLFSYYEYWEPGRRLFKYLPGYTKAKTIKCWWRIDQAVDKPYGIILRNRTAKVYVDLVYLKEAIDITNWTVIILQITWSDDPSCTMYSEEDRHRGPWAGHRLDVTSADDIDETWTNVSEEVAEKFKDFKEW